MPWKCPACPYAVDAKTKRWSQQKAEDHERGLRLHVETVQKHLAELRANPDGTFRCRAYACPFHSYGPAEGVLKTVEAHLARVETHLATLLADPTRGVTC